MAAAESCRPHSVRVALRYRFRLACGWLLAWTAAASAVQLDESAPAWQAMQAAERARIEMIQRVIGSVVAVYGEDRQGGGSGVIIDPSGLALTNHHVIQGAGTSGWGGLADGKLYRWTVIGTDPGGDIALIQLEGRDDFPASRLGDSAQVQVGDWALAMGNPFVLTEDETPTVTLGIVSGVKRFQEGAGSNQLVYGNCIQVDSSINPGNSGGPLFNLAGEVIGINGRGSFEARGRVNVGLGYAISANQIKQFLPDLLATKLVEHGTPDATFELRQGKIVCASLEQECEARRQGLELEDELLELEGQPVQTVNQYLNLLCTLPAGWPTDLKIRKPDGRELTLRLRLYGLPYNIPAPPPQPVPDQPTPEQKKALERNEQMVRLLTSPPGAIRDPERNQRSLAWLSAFWAQPGPQPPQAWELVDHVERDGQRVGEQRLLLDSQGRFVCTWREGDATTSWGFDGTTFWRRDAAGTKPLSLIEAKLVPQILQVAGIASQWTDGLLSHWGRAELDGGDQAQGELACRVKITDAKQDSLYAWFSLLAADGGWRVQPLKIAADLDPSETGVAVGFADWETREQLRLPRVRTWQRGPEERVDLTLQHSSVTAQPSVAAAQFAPPASTEPGSKETPE